MNKWRLWLARAACPHGFIVSQAIPREPSDVARLKIALDTEEFTRQLAEVERGLTRLAAIFPWMPKRPVA